MGTENSILNLNNNTLFSMNILKHIENNNRTQNLIGLYFNGLNTNKKLQ